MVASRCAPSERTGLPESSNCRTVRSLLDISLLEGQVFRQRTATSLLLTSLLLTSRGPARLCSGLN